MEPFAAVEDFDVVGHGEACPDASRMRVPVVALDFQACEERLGGDVVPADPGAAMLAMITLRFTLQWWENSFERVLGAAV